MSRLLVVLLLSWWLPAVARSDNALFVNRSLGVETVGELVALGVTGPLPSRLLPGVKPLIEQGFPGLVVFSWYGVLAPARATERAGHRPGVGRRAASQPGDCRRPDALGPARARGEDRGASVSLQHGERAGERIPAGALADGVQLFQLQISV